MSKNSVFTRANSWSLLVCAAAGLLLPAASAQQAPPASLARILLLPRRIVSGERATLAVLDVNGRLTPDVSIEFSNGDRFTTDISGRALFVAPLNPGLISASIAGRPGKVSTTVVNATEAASASMTVSYAPRVASITDRFEIFGQGFCGDADANQVKVAGQTALVLASSPTSLVILPPQDLDPGSAVVNVSCSKRVSPNFTLTFVALALEADTSPLAPAEHRILTVRVSGTSSKIPLEALNLAPEVAELAGGRSVRVITTGGADNFGRFEVVGRQRGSFLISIRLAPAQARPRP
jgi:hypothetical protein